MKIPKIALKIIPIVMLCLAWISFLSTTVGTYSEYRSMVKKGEKSIEDGLYEQAVEFYKGAYSIQEEESLYIKMIDAYDKLYAEEHTAFVRGLYIADMEIASSLYQNNPMFWLKQAELHMDGLDYTKAYAVINKARSYNVKSEEIDALYYELLYMVKTDYKIYYDFKTALNGYISAYDGSMWVLLDENGEELTSKYEYIGLVNDNGKGLYVNDLGIRVLDETQVTRMRLDIDGKVTEAGYYNESVDLLPIKIDEKWRYVNSKSEFLDGEFEIAGSFYDGNAVAKVDDKWVLLDKEGNQTSLEQFEDIKLDLYGCHIQGNVVIAKENGMYHLYDNEFNQIGDFAADNMDICINDELIAYEKENKWGFVDTTGKIVVEPTYTKAKSFSNGYAAVKTSDGLWGFLNDECQLVIDAQFLEGFYFTESETCFVSVAEDCIQMMHFVFD